MATSGKGANLSMYQKVERPNLASHDSTVLDLAFALDCTSSMSHFILQAQQNIRHIVEEIVAKEKSDIHLALVEYRDHPPQDYTYVTRVHDFTPSVKEMKTWLDASEASGGGDGPEAVADAWHAVLKLDWRPEATKICVHIADAPPHGLGFKSGDGFPDGCPAGLDPVAIMHQLAEKGVTLYMCGCEPDVNICRNFYMTMAHITGGQYVPLTNAKLLTQVIIGGAEEELSLEKLMAEVEIDVQQERSVRGKDLDVEELSKKVHDKLANKGVKSKQLRYGMSSMPSAPDWAGPMSTNTDLPSMCAALTSEGLMDEERMHPSFPLGPVPRRRPMSLMSIGAVMIEDMTDSADTRVGVPAKYDLGSYDTCEAVVNMDQAKRMVQKVMKRNK